MHTKITVLQMMGYVLLAGFAGVSLGLAIGYVLTDVIGLH